jgi:hypothetical protein
MFGSFRYILAAMVVVTHLGPGAQVAWGGWGFFVVSGYLMSLVLDRTYPYSGIGLTRSSATARFVSIPPVSSRVCFHWACSWCGPPRRRASTRDCSGMGRRWNGFRSSRSWGNSALTGRWCHRRGRCTSNSSSALQWGSGWRATGRPSPRGSRRVFSMPPICSSRIRRCSSATRVSGLAYARFVLPAASS